MSDSYVDRLLEEEQAVPTLAGAAGMYLPLRGFWGVKDLPVAQAKGFPTIGALAKKARPGDVVTFGSSGLSLPKLFVAAGMGTPGAYHTAVIESIDKKGNLTVLEMTPDAGYSRRTIPATSKASAVLQRPKGDRDVLGNLRKMIDVQNKVESSLIGRGIPPEQARQTMLKAYGGAPMMVEHGVRELFTVGDTTLDPKLQYQSLSAELDTLHKNPSNLTDTLHRKLLSGDSIDYRDFGCVGGVCTDAAAKAGVPVSDNTVLRRANPRDIMSSPDLETIGKRMSPADEFTNKILRHAPKAMRVGAGLGLGAAGYYGAKSLMEPEPTGLEKWLGKFSSENLVMYHGSPEDIAKFELRPHKLSGGEGVVFGTPNRAQALASLQQWSDNDFEQGYYNDEPMYMREMYPGAFEKIYGGKGGYLYSLDPSSFESQDNLMRTEALSRVAPKILKKEYIEDALKALRESGATFIPYEKTAGVRTQDLKNALKELLTTAPSKEHIDAWSRHSALNLGQVSEHLAKVVGGRNRGLKQSRGEELKDALNSLIYSALPPTHHTAKEMASMLPHSHRSWYRFGKGGPNPADTVKTSSYNSEEVSSEDLAASAAGASLLAVPAALQPYIGKEVLRYEKGKPIVILHTTAARGAGHASQAKNIAKAFRQRGVEVKVIDVEKDFAKSKQGYNDYVNRYKDVMSGKRTHTSWGLDFAKYHTLGIDRKALAKELGNAGAVITTASSIRPFIPDTGKAVNVVFSDISQHLPYNRGLDLLNDRDVRFTPDKNMLKGNPRNTRVLQNVPLDPGLFDSKAPTGLLDPNRFNVTLSGGGTGYDVEKITRQILNSQAREVGGKKILFHAIAANMSQKDPARYQELLRLAEQHPDRLRLHDRVPLANLLSEADLNVLRPSGTTVAEATFARKPMLQIVRGGLDSAGNPLLLDSMNSQNAIGVRKQTGAPIASLGGPVSGYSPDVHSKFDSMLSKLDLRRQGVSSAADAFSDTAGQIADDVLRKPTTWAPGRIPYAKPLAALGLIGGLGFGGAALAQDD